MNQPAVKNTYHLLFSVIFFVFFGLAMAGCNSVQHQEEKNVVGQITQYGVYKKVRVDSSISAPYTATGHRDLGEAELQLSGDSVKVSKGQGIGFNYRITLKEIRGANKLKVVINHPELTNKEGKTYRTSVYFRKLPDNPGVCDSFDVYFFDEPFEMISGDWSIQIFYEDKLVLGKAFHVSF